MRQNSRWACRRRGEVRPAVARAGGLLPHSPARYPMNFLETLSTFQQMTLFAAIIIVWAVAMTVGAVIVAHRQNLRFQGRKRQKRRFSNWRNY